MQTSGVFPQLYEGRMKARPGEKPVKRRSRPEPPEDGAGWTKTQPRPINAARSLGGRRADARKKARALVGKD